MIDAIAKCTDRLIKVEGGVRTGKTEALIKRAATLINAGQAPESILVAATNAFSAQAFRQRLRRALNQAEAADRVVIEPAIEA